MNTFDTYHNSPKRAHQQQYDTEMHFKTEPYQESILSYPTHQNHEQHHPAPYYNPSTFSEQELAESLGWPYSNAHQVPGIPAQHHMQLSQDMIQGMSPHPASYGNSAIPTPGNTFGSVAIPQTTGSPAGWHSSLESGPGYLDTNSMARSSYGPNQSNGLRKDGTTVAEKKAMRRYSHNAGMYTYMVTLMIVERRRRDNINEQIQELAALVPSGFLGPNTAAASPRADTLNGAAKPNKGVVLRKSVEYIQLLRSIVEEKAERERQMGGYVPPRKSEDSSVWVDEFAVAEDED